MPPENSLPGELLSVPPLAAKLLEFARQGVTHDLDAYCDSIRRTGCTDPEGILQDLRAAGFFAVSASGYTLSSRAYRSLLFISGALGVGSDQVVDELRISDPSLQRYELVREGMTSRFIKGLLVNSQFQRLYICSPWINLLKKDLGRLAVALGKAEEALVRPPEILVLVQTPKLPEIRQSIEALRSMGAKVIEKPKLHSKLYMREPGPAGGLSLAIVGSENLTRPKWIELGIEIRNDNYLLSRLRSYFFDVYGRPGGE